MNVGGPATPDGTGGPVELRHDYWTTITLSPAERPKVSGMYISSALAGGTTKVPGVVARRCGRPVLSRPRGHLHITPEQRAARACEGGVGDELGRVGRREAGCRDTLPGVTGWWRDFGAARFGRPAPVWAPASGGLWYELLREVDALAGGVDPDYARGFLAGVCRWQTNRAGT